MEPIQRFPSTSYLFVCACLLSLIVNASGVRLRIVPSSLTSQQTRIAANFPFYPALEVEVIADADENRITTGADATLTVTPVLSNTSVCLSVDSAFQLKDGHAIFPGSICEVVDSITMHFTATASSGSVATNNTKLFNVTGELHIAYLHKEFYYLNGRREQNMRDRIKDLNDGFFQAENQTLFPGREMFLQTYYYPTMLPDEAMRTYFQMRKYHQENPEKKAYALIGFENNVISKSLLPLTAVDDYSVLSYTGDSATEFGNKVKYPTFNRITYSEDVVENAFILYLKRRKWNKIIIISGNTGFSSHFYLAAVTHGIEIVGEYALNTIDDEVTEPSGKYEVMFDSILSKGYNIIVNNIQHRQTGKYLYSEAVRKNVTNMDRFQWVGYKNQDVFPYFNEPPGCRDGEFRICAKRFNGMEFIHPTYLVSGWQTREWDHVWNSGFRNDEYKTYVGFNDIDLTTEGTDTGLSMDAVTTYILAMKRFLDAKRTITGMALALDIRANTDFVGLTGGTSRVKIDPSTGNRQDLEIEVEALYTPWILYDDRVFYSHRRYYEFWGVFKETRSTNSFFTVKSNHDTEFIEKTTNGRQRTRQARGVYDPTSQITLYAEYYMERPHLMNNITYRAYKGVFHYDQQAQSEIDWSKNNIPVFLPSIEETTTQLVPPTHYCSIGCGGNPTDISDLTKYENGDCIKQDTCLCKKSNGVDLWKGDDCGVPVCSTCSQFGDCVSPGNCVCKAGYTGAGCVTPICLVCSSGGDCVTPGYCRCKSNQFGEGCDKKCTCVNGECNIGKNGDGKCKTCDSGYIGANCDISLWALILPIIIGGGLIVVGVVFLIKYSIKRAKLKAALFNNDWIVNWSDFKRHDEVTGRSSMFISAISMNNNDNRRKQVNTGLWEGIDVHYQKLEKGSINLTDSLRLEVKQMRDVRHINIAQFVGCCVESPNVSILTELQPKGSLDDILTNEDIKLPWNFRFALMKGMCSGLDYLHKSEIKSHGRFKSSNVLIDNRWTVKLSGFGLYQIKSDQKNVGPFNPHQSQKDVDRSKSNYGSLLWTAPELLRTGAYHIDHIGRGSVEGDIYSLGMVISEMCTRDFPFADVMLEKEDLVSLILGNKNDAIMKIWNDYLAKLNVEQGGWVRPCIKDKEWPSKYEKRKALKKLMESAWHEDPVHRPTVMEVRSELERIDPQRGELMDHLVTMLEKYSSNLEDIVTKRTKQLQKEKQKTEDLVSRLLPKSVAEDLKQGKRVEPVGYDYVTIYFSDIVGFTSIAKASTPLEVVALLNDMYTTFDSIAANYDVYKVETIGDAYMVVSGLPTKNGDKHAGEICTTALDLMCAIGEFEIAHMKDTKLSLRSGIHTGNVVAGVVGLKMPRYCLFGESVNVASKMESGGEPLRIHISEETYKILNRLGGYECEYRQEIDVKGIGMIKTYWLNGKAGYTKKLPTPPIDED